MRHAAAELAAGSRVRRMTIAGRELVEVPVTAMPFTRLPIHASHLQTLARHAPRLATRYLELALDACAREGIAPAIVIHPTDLLERGDAPSLAGFPAMRTPAARKIRFVQLWLERVEARVALGTVSDQAAAVAAAV